MEIDPKRGEHMYCNSQVYGLGGFARPKGSSVPKVGVDSQENYQFPWTSNFCEKRGRSGNKACGTIYKEHLGQDCRPPRPTSRPRYWVTTVDDGRVSSFGKGHLVSVQNQRYRWTYLHMANRQVRKGQSVTKGQRLGQVWNKTNTSIHLHIELRVKDGKRFRVVDPMPSLIVAYRKTLGHDVSSLVDRNGTLIVDPAYEVLSGAAPSQTSKVTCAGA